MRIPGATQPDSLWTYGFVHDELASGCMLKLLCVLDDHKGEVPSYRSGKVTAESRWNFDAVAPNRLQGKPVFLRPDSMAEFTATAVMNWLGDQKVEPAYITYGSP